MESVSGSSSTVSDHGLLFSNLEIGKQYYQFLRTQSLMSTWYLDSIRGIVNSEIRSILTLPSLNSTEILYSRLDEEPILRVYLLQYIHHFSVFKEYPEEVLTFFKTWQNYGRMSEDDLLKTLRKEVQRSRGTIQKQIAEIFSEIFSVDPGDSGPRFSSPKPYCPGLDQDSSSSIIGEKSNEGTKFQKFMDSEYIYYLRFEKGYTMNSLDKIKFFDNWLKFYKSPGPLFDRGLTVDMKSKLNLPDSLFRIDLSHIDEHALIKEKPKAKNIDDYVNNGPNLFGGRVRSEEEKNLLRRVNKQSSLTRSERLEDAFETLKKELKEKDEELKRLRKKEEECKMLKDKIKQLKMDHIRLEDLIKSKVEKSKIEKSKSMNDLKIDNAINYDSDDSIADYDDVYISDDSDSDSDSNSDSDYDDVDISEHTDEAKIENLDLPATEKIKINNPLNFSSSLANIVATTIAITQNNNTDNVLNQNYHVAVVKNSGNMIIQISQL